MTTTNYRIIVTTDAYNAQRSTMFKNHSTEAVISDNLTLKEAQKELLRLFIDKSETYYPNWGLAVAHSHLSCEAFPTFSDGTRRFVYDVYTYSIEIKDEE